MNFIPSLWLLPQRRLAARHRSDVMWACPKIGYLTSKSRWIIMVYHHFPDFSMATFLGESIRIEMATSCSCSRRIAFQFTSELPTILTGKLAAMNCASVGLCLHGASWKYNPFKSAQSIVLVHTCIIWICILILSITYRHISYHIISYYIISYHIIYNIYK